MSQIFTVKKEINNKAIKLKLSTDEKKNLGKKKNHWLIFLQKQNQVASLPQHSQCSCLVLAGTVLSASFLPLPSCLGALLASGCGLGALAQLKPRVASVPDMLGLVVRKETIVKNLKTRVSLIRSRLLRQVLESPEVHLDRKISKSMVSSNMV